MDKNCLWCGLKLIDNSPLQNKKYCDINCREAVRRRRKLISKSQQKAPKDLEGEKWVNITGWESCYQVSNKGRIRQKIDYLYFSGRNYPGRHFVGQKTTKGYIRVSFRSKKLGKPHPKWFRTHRLVAVAFIPNPLSRSEINHKNGRKDDNRIENLEWCTSEENRNHYQKFIKQGLLSSN